MRLDSGPGLHPRNRARVAMVAPITLGIDSTPPGTGPPQTVHYPRGQSRTGTETQLSQGELVLEPRDFPSQASSERMYHRQQDPEGSREAYPSGSSLSSPDEATAPGDVHPPDDLKQFQELFKRVAFTQGIQTAEVQEKHHKLLKNLRPPASSKIAILLNEAIMESATTIWQTPASAPPINKRADKKYFIPAKGMEFLFSHPQPNSLVVESSQQRSKTSQYKAGGMDKDAKKLELFGRQVYSSTLLLRMANYAAHPANRNFDNYSRLTCLMDSLPEDKKPVLKAIVQEGYAASRTGVQIALDVADTAARSTATAVVMRRESWLQTSGIPRDLQVKIVDLPFDTQKLFAESTDSVLHSSKDSRATLRTLGIYTPPYRKKKYYPQQRRYPYQPQRAQYQMGYEQGRHQQHQQYRTPRRRSQQSCASAGQGQRQQV
ncbi:deubiquitinase OTUD6B isoform X1 [Carettochelys insculpta]|uniref:deubiquitinase OTUD6B isoform X1 n=1 Tax=Carettochelys insculpta TaxID=44489 RepID=UPI003EBC832F